MMENLIEDHVAQASTVRTATVVADAAPDPSAPRPRGAAGPPAHPHAPASQPSAACRRLRRAAGRRRQRRGGRRAVAPVAAATERPRPPAHRPIRRGRAPRRRAAAARTADRLAAGPARWSSRPTAARPGARPPSPAIAGARPDDSFARAQPADAPSQGEDAERRLGGDRKLDDPDRRDRRRRQGDRSSRQGARAEPFDPRCGQAGHRESAQGGGHGLPRALRRPRLRIGGNRLPLPQALRIFLFRGPRLRRNLEPRSASREPASLVAASRHPWPD